MDFPRLTDAKIIGFDTETHDPNLKTKGCGAVRKDGKIVGISLAVSRADKWYFPIAHEGGGNMDKESAIRFCKDVLETDIPKVGANVNYDREWLETEGIFVKGPFNDVLIAEPLINEQALEYSLGSVAQKYLGVPKTEQLMLQSLVDLGLCTHRDALSVKKSSIWRLPAEFVSEYAMDDAAFPIEIFEKQKKILEQEDLMQVYTMEVKLLDIMKGMRSKGVRVDLERAHNTRVKLVNKERELQEEISKIGGFDVNVDASTDLISLWEKLEIPIVYTAKGNASFTKDYLKELEHPVAKMVTELRNTKKFISTFIDGYILGSNVNGRVYPTLNSMKSDDGGTETGRFSCVKPNLQNIPSAEKSSLGKEIRAIFLPEEKQYWYACDYSQQEPRVTIHFGYVRGFPGADKARMQFINDPGTDYHQMVADLANIARKPAKVINLGLAYGMGGAKLCRNLGLPTDLIEIGGRWIEVAGEAGRELLKKYNEAVPYVKYLSNDTMRLAEARGYVRTISGRRRRFNLWQSRDKWGTEALPYEEAVEKYGNIKRAFCHKALNTIIQGSSADMIKQAMINVYEEEKIIPLVTVHDELGISAEEDSVAMRVKDVMLSCMPELTVPLKVDIDKGHNWGEAISIQEFNRA